MRLFMGVLGYMVTGADGVGNAGMDELAQHGGGLVERNVGPVAQLLERVGGSGAGAVQVGEEAQGGGGERVGGYLADEVDIGLGDDAAVVEDGAGTGKVQELLDEAVGHFGVGEGLGAGGSAEAAHEVGGVVHDILKVWG